MSIVGKKRLGLFGGTFDPVHAGHLAVARHAAQHLSLAEVVFIPAADPPHKRSTAVSFTHRVAMLEIALQECRQNFTVSLLEGERESPSYTVDTLFRLKQQTGESNTKLFFIIGADSLIELHLWYRYQRLFELTDFVVVSRPGVDLSRVTEAINNLPGEFMCQNSEKMHWQRSDGASMYYLDGCNAAVSSSEIRNQLKAGNHPESIAPGVLDYIVSNRLYLHKPHGTQQD